MKSPQDGKHSHETACKTCVFAVWQGDTQTGCSLGRVEAYLSSDRAFEAYDDEKEFYVVKGICNAVRDTSWNDGVVDVEKVKEEIKPKFLAIVLSDHMSQSSINEIVAMSQDTEYDIVWNVVSSFSVTKEEKKKLRPLLEGLPNPLITECVNENYTVGEIIGQSRRSFTVVFDKLTVNDGRIFSRVNESLNDDLEKFVLYNFNGVQAISNLAYNIYAKELETVVFDQVITKIESEAKKLGLEITEVEE